MQYKPGDKLNSYDVIWYKNQMSIILAYTNIQIRPIIIILSQEGELFMPEPEDLKHIQLISPIIIT